MGEQMGFDAEIKPAEGELLTTTTVKAMPPGIRPEELAQAIVDFVECEAAYLEQAFERIRPKMHADGAEARLPRARSRLKQLARIIARANGVRA